MIKIIKLNPSNIEKLEIVKKEALKISSTLLKKKIVNLEEIRDLIKLSPKKRQIIFDSFNMMHSLQMLHYEMKNILTKNFKENSLLWTYPQIRIDGDFADNFTAPIHKDAWILSHKKKGCIIWLTLNQNGGNLLIGSNQKLKKIIKNKYWGLESKDEIIFKEKKIKYGEALIFDHNLAHRSSLKDDFRISIQLRYEEINLLNFRRSVTQKTDPLIKNYWFKRFNN